MAATAQPSSSLPLPRRAEAESEPTAVLVGESARFQGLVTFRGCAQVDGEIEGEIVCRGTLRLGLTALVSGTIDVDELIVDGTLEGDVTARQRIELSSSARVKGTLRAPRIALAEGCLLDGRCETGSPSTDS